MEKSLDIQLFTRGKEKEKEKRTFSVNAILGQVDHQSHQKPEENMSFTSYLS